MFRREGRGIPHGGEVREGGKCSAGRGRCYMCSTHACKDFHHSTQVFGMVSSCDARS